MFQPLRRDISVLNPGFTWSWCIHPTRISAMGLFGCTFVLPKRELMLSSCIIVCLVCLWLVTTSDSYKVHFMLSGCAASWCFTKKRFLVEHFLLNASRHIWPNQTLICPLIFHDVLIFYYIVKISIWICQGIQDYSCFIAYFAFLINTAVCLFAFCMKS